MKIVVTGGAGFIGSHVVDAFLAAGHEVVVIDNFSTGKLANLAPDNRSGLRIVELDIRDVEGLRTFMKREQPDVVDHHAAQISVVASAEDPRYDLDLNIGGTVNLLEAIRLEAPRAKVIYASSGGAMYGPDGPLPHTEQSQADPASPYGLSKHTAERYVWLYRQLYGMKATVLRYSNVYGPRQDAHGEAGVCAIFTERMLAGQPVTIFGNGTPTRDYVYVGDVAAANAKALEQGEGEAFNISTGKETSTREVCNTIKAATGYTGEVKEAPLRPGELQACVLSPEKAERILGWKAVVKFKDGIDKTIAWYKQTNRLDQ